MPTKTATPDQELKLFQKLVGLLKKTPSWNKDPDMTKIFNDLCTNTSKEAQGVRDIMWRMVRAEHKAIKKNQKAA